VTLPFYIKKKYLGDKKKNYGNSNISPCKYIIFPPKKNPLIEETKILSRYYYYNSIITNLKFQHKPKSSYFKKTSY
jgi:hypothetical protein